MISISHLVRHSRKKDFTQYIEFHADKTECRDHSLFNAAPTWSHISTPGSILTTVEKYLAKLSEVVAKLRRWMLLFRDRHQTQRPSIPMNSEFKLCQLET